MRKVYWGAALAGACALAFLLFPRQVEPIYWQAGARQMYHFSHENNTAGTPPVGEETTSRQIVGGIVNLRVFEADEKIVKIGVQISSVAVMAGGARLTGLEKLLSSFFLAELTPDGRFLRFHFDPAVSAEDGKGIINFLQAFQCIIQPGRSSTWSYEESDGIGDYRSRYTAKRRYVVKRKEEYRRVNGPGFSGSPDSDIKAAIGGKSKLVVYYGKPVSWIRTAREAERVELSVNGRKVASFSVVASLNLAEFEPDPALQIWKQEGPFDSIVARWGSSPRRQGSFWKDLELSSLKKKYAGKSFRELLKGFTVTRKMIPWDSINALRDYLLVNPAECARVSGYLRDGSLNNIQQAALIHVLELTGHEDAQRALAGIINDRSHTMMNRVRSIIALSGVGAPSDNSIDNLFEINRAGERELSHTALLGLGNAGRSLALTTGDEASDRRRGRIREYLQKELAAGAGDADKTSIALAAIGNSRDGSFTEQIAACLNDGNPRVRASAAMAAVAVGDDAARESVVSMLRDEKRQEVKAAIVNSLYEKPGMESAMRLIADTVIDESDSGVRKAMLRYLVKNRDAYPGATNVFEKMLQTEQNPENRRLIYQGLYSKQR